MSFNFVTTLLIIGFPVIIQAQDSDYLDYFENPQKIRTKGSSNYANLSSSITPSDLSTVRPTFTQPSNETSTLPDLNFTYSTTTMLSGSEENATYGISNTTESNFTDFPQPWNTFQTMMNKAKEFAQHYMSKENIHKLRLQVQQARANSANVEQVRATVLKFLNSVLTPQQKKEIRARKDELEEEFSDANFIPK